MSSLRDLCRLQMALVYISSFGEVHKYLDSVLHSSGSEMLVEPGASQMKLAWRVKGIDL